MINFKKQVPTEIISIVEKKILDYLNIRFEYPFCLFDLGWEEFNDIVTRSLQMIFIFHE